MTRARSRVPSGGVLLLEQLALVVDARHEVAAVVGQQHLDRDRRAAAARGAISARSSSSPSPVRAETTTRVLLAAPQPVDDQRVGDVGLVDDDDLLTDGASTSAQHLAHRGELGLGVGVGAVDDVQDQVGVGDLLQRGAERLDQLVRQVAHEADRVGERVDRGRPSVSARRTVGSRVANSAFSTSTPAPVSRLSSEDLPALV